MPPIAVFMLATLGGGVLMWFAIVGEGWRTQLLCAVVILASLGGALTLALAGGG